MSGRRSDRRGYEKMNYDMHVARVKGAKGSVDCLPPRPHPLANRSETDQVTITLRYVVLSGNIE